jgi:tRNA pseudouridine55 synthase
VHGWLVLDKPVGMTSTHAGQRGQAPVPGQTRRTCRHARSTRIGAVAIALGEATKTVPFVMDGRKVYRFTVRLGRERTPTTPKGRATETTRNARPPRRIRALITLQRPHRKVPPRFSAVKIDGEPRLTIWRATARLWNYCATPEIEIHHLELVETPRLRTRRARRRVRQGTYVRALSARHGPRARLLWTCRALRPHRGRPFTEQIATNLESIAAHDAALAPSRCRDGAGHSAGRSRLAAFRRCG